MSEIFDIEEEDAYRRANPHLWTTQDAADFGSISQEEADEDAEFRRRQRARQPYPGEPSAWPELAGLPEVPWDDPFAEPDDPTTPGAQPTDDAEYEDALIAQAETEEPGAGEWPEPLPQELP